MTSATDVLMWKTAAIMIHDVTPGVNRRPDLQLTHKDLLRKDQQQTAAPKIIPAGKKLPSVFATGRL